MNIGTPTRLIAALALAGLSATAQAAAPAPVSAESLCAFEGHRMNTAEAARFLGQATFGPSTASIEELCHLGYNDWITAQFAIEHVPLNTNLYYLDHRSPAPVNGKLDQTHWVESFWRQAIGDGGQVGKDQLRQRVAFALSEIFVVSFNSGAVTFKPRGMADYYDKLGKYGLMNFRDLLKMVATHPMMGLYLSHLRNEKETPPNVAVQRVPDENFAREIMQLFSIGLYKLDTNGERLLDAQNNPIETYKHEDVEGLAKVFTGWSWGGGTNTALRFYGDDDSVKPPDREIVPMQMYPYFHSTSSKAFLTKTIPASNASNAGETEMDQAIDELFNHDNVGPFIGRQLIQRLVTSNPSPDYVRRVALAFNTPGDRGNMQTVIRAILMDDEARLPNARTYKLREPIVRAANWARAFNAYSNSGNFRAYIADDPVATFGQSPLRAPSVFNYFRPAYMPSSWTISHPELVAPELQTTSELSVTGYLNALEEMVRKGFGAPTYSTGGVYADHDITSQYVNEYALASEPDKLIRHVSILLTNDTLPDTYRALIKARMQTIYFPALKSDNSNAAAVLMGVRNRVGLAIYMTMAAPEYLVQK
ncbi:DUF1800 family protein [Oxalobacteraceae bacterium]|nr:DUF1800 family protein [Oxalobacteraceae bacterium]